MNIYQEVYDIVKNAKTKWYEEAINPHKKHPSDIVELSEAALEQQWFFVAHYLQEHASPQIIKIAKEKYPILQQIFQMNESEVRS